MWPNAIRLNCSVVSPVSVVACVGNEVCFSLETASDYVKDEKACFFGFHCTVVGYEWPSSAQLVRCHTTRNVEVFKNLYYRLM